MSTLHVIQLSVQFPHVKLLELPLCVILGNASIKMFAVFNYIVCPSVGYIFE
jgi:hypothetical protein